MNYILQINNFWAHIENKKISSTDISVYFTLLKYCNKLNWLNPFVCHYDIVCQYAGISKNTFYKSMDRLTQLDLIEFTKGSRNALAPKVLVLNLKNNKGTIMEQNYEQEGNLYKLINNKTKELILSNIDLVNEKLEGWIYSEKEKPNEDISISEIISYLNQVTGKKFSPKTATTKKLIGARLKVYSVEDAKKVIDVKSKQWLNDAVMNKYLSPDTLFAEKNFEKYLNETAAKPIKEPIKAIEYTDIFPNTAPPTRI